MDNRLRLSLSLATVVSLASPATLGATLSTAPFGTTAGGRPVSLTTMTSGRGLTVKFMSYGGIITQILAPDRHGQVADVVLGFPTLHDYETKSAQGGLYFGALVGRYANRIAKGRFTLDGHDYTLAINNPPNSLHGGSVGFDKKVWEVQPTATSGSSVSATLRLTSPDGEEGYPGTLAVTVTYTLRDDNSFTIHYGATTDKDTVINLTNHSYFNLAGVGAQDGVFPQVLMINADNYLPTDSTAIPLGQTAPVANTPFDFRQPTPIGARIRDSDQQLLWAHGYDHNWVLTKQGDAHTPQLAARAYDSASGRTLECLTTEPGVQLYTANFLVGAYAGNGGIFPPERRLRAGNAAFPRQPKPAGFPDH